MVIGKIFARNARRYPKREGVIYQDTRLTFRDLNERLNRLTHTLVHLGAQRQELWPDIRLGL
jgi:feruloyl-CoA synthase